MQTLRSTLLKYPSSLLAKMFQHGSTLCSMTKDGAYFVDRNAASFAWVLSYLRSGVIAPDLTNGQLEELGREADYFRLQDLRKKVDAALDRGEKLIKFNVAGVEHKIELSLFGDIPKDKICEYLELSLGLDVSRDKNGAIFFHNAGSFSLLINSLRHGRDITRSAVSGHDFARYERVSYAARLFLFLIKGFYKKEKLIRVELKVKETNNSWISTERTVERKLLLKDPHSTVAKFLLTSDLPRDNMLNENGCLILLSKKQDIHKIEALLEQMQYTDVIDSPTYRYVDEMSQLAKELGLLSQDNILSATHFKKA
eukprot:TRINITY_DN14214_c0_g1_i2.p1 TRINITY_DN14214_c0_g1~~TRINITY_DN14214_c0_g1_i2.p1  ORF type:complete len:312 (-),score=48.13 TRINITY_DN14214_c0_g1_i2:285-1220(-)